MLGLSNDQLTRLQDASAMLPEQQRRNFIRSVGNVLLQAGRLVTITDANWKTPSDLCWPRAAFRLRRLSSRSNLNAANGRAFAWETIKHENQLKQIAA
jgi:hypothetical protein